MTRFSSDKLPTCPFVVTQKVLSGKWAILILHALEQGPKRFNALHRELSGITQATLTKQLRQLEEDGIILRKAYPQIPPKVEYQLTEIGTEFRLVPYTSYLTDDIQLNHGRPSPKGRPLYQRIHHSNSNQ